MGNKKQGRLEAAEEVFTSAKHVSHREADSQDCEINHCRHFGGLPRIEGLLLWNEPVISRLEDPVTLRY